MPSSSKKKIPVMENSGQTDAERRELRRSYRHLQKVIRNDAEALEDATSGKFSDVRDENNYLWNQVRYTREAVLDGENLDLIATRASRQVDKLVEVPRYDAIRFCAKLKQKVGGRDGSLDWNKLGCEVGVCFNSIPSNVTFYTGPLNADYTPKQRAPRKKKVVEESDGEEEEEEPEDVKAHAKNPDQLSAVERNIKEVHEVLKKRSNESYRKNTAAIEDIPEAKRARGGEIGAIQYLFNPKSFTQTVENLFHFSFLLKQGHAGIRVTDDKGPTVSQHRTDVFPPPRQAIVSLNMKEWRRLNEAYEVQQGFIPHRSSSKVSQKSISQP